MQRVPLDRIDLELLRYLQVDARLAGKPLAQHLQITNRLCHRRVERLWRRGIILSAGAKLDRAQLNLPVMAIVKISASPAVSDWEQRFRRVVDNFPEIIEVLRLSGRMDFMLRVVTPDLATYNRIYLAFVQQLECRSLSTDFILDEIKSANFLPLIYA